MCLRAGCAVDRDRVRAAGPDERGMRQRRVAHARNLAADDAADRRRRRRPGLRIAGLRRIQLEQQHVLAIEAERHRLEIRQRPHEQAGRHQQQQRDRDLRHHQHLRQAQARDAVAQTRPRLADRPISERRHQRRTRRLQRGREAEQHAAQQRQRQRDAEHMPVQFGVQRESLLAVGQQQRQHADADDGDEDAERAAERRRAERSR